MRTKPMLKNRASTPLERISTLQPLSRASTSEYQNALTKSIPTTAQRITPHLFRCHSPTPAIVSSMPMATKTAAKRRCCWRVSDRMTKRARGTASPQAADRKAAIQIKKQIFDTRSGRSLLNDGPTGWFFVSVPCGLCTICSSTYRSTILPSDFLVSFQPPGKLPERSPTAYCDVPIISQCAISSECRASRISGAASSPLALQCCSSPR